MTRFNLFVLLTFALAVLMVSGCSKEADTTGPVDGGPLPGSGTTVPTGKRIQILNSFTAVSDSLPGVDTNADNQKLLNFLKAQPEFEGSGISATGSVWARFTDGRLLIYSNALVNPPGLEKSGFPSALQETRKAQKSSDNLPGSDLAVVLNSLGSAFDYFGPTSPIGAEQTRQDIGTMLSDAGYFVDANHDASVIGLTTIINNVGVLHWTSHGGDGLGRDGTKYYGIWTTDIADTTSDEHVANKKMLDANELVYFAAPNIKQIFYPKKEVHYAVTSKFVEKYMHFAPNSLVYVTACWSAFDEQMVQAFRTAGASVYAGWSNAVNPPEAFNAARFFFDRSLGANTVKPIPNARQRPFEFYLVYDDMLFRKLTQSSTAAHGPANLSFTQLKGDFMQLLPTIQFATPVLRDQMYLDVNGAFGDKIGKVTLNGSPLPIPAGAWLNSVIKLKHPDTGGILRVEVDAFKSNPVPLTEWDGTFSYTNTGNGTLKQTVSVSVKLISDMHRFRLTSGANMFYPDRDYFLMPRALIVSGTSGGTYSCSGEYRDPSTDELLESWSGGGSISHINLGTTGTGFTVSATLDSVGSVANMFVFMTGPYTRYTKASGSQPAFLSIQNGSFQFSVTSGYVIPPYTNTSGNAKFDWSGSTPQYLQASSDPR